MKVFKAIIRILLILIITGLLSFISIYAPMSKIVFDQNEIEQIIDNSSIYEEVNDRSKKLIVKTINEGLDELPEDIRKEIDVKAIIDEVDITDLLRYLVNECIDIVYSTKTNKINLKEITTSYINKFDTYLRENGVEIPQEILDDIYKEISDSALDEELDIDELNKNLDELSKEIQNYKSISTMIQVIIIVIIIGLVLLLLVLSNHKIRSIVPIFILTSLFLLLVEILSYAIVISSVENEGKLVEGIFMSIINSIFLYVNMFIIVFVITIITLIIIGIFKKNKNNKSKEETKKDE